MAASGIAISGFECCCMAYSLVSYILTEVGVILTYFGENASNSLKEYLINVCSNIIGS